MKFLAEFEKTVSKIEGVGGSSQPPRYWYSTGNYVLNRILSGSFMKGIPQGRLTGLVGPSGSGKSFVLANVVKHAQQAGAYILVVDSENALDDDYMSAVGVDVTSGYKYKSVTTIPQVTKVVSAFLKGFKGDYGSDPDAPQIFIAIDSLDMLLTETELEHYSKGVQKGDQGQRNKQLKAMLRTFVQDIKDLNVTMVVTDQVYRNQDVMNGEGVFMVKDAVKYSLSQIAMLTKLKLKDKATKDVEGIKMKCEGYKTRFTKPFQTVTIEVPYDTGMDPYSGLKEVAVALGVIVQKGSRLAIAGADKSWYEKDIGEYADEILAKLEAKANTFVDVFDFTNEEEEAETKEEASATRDKKVKEKIKSE